MDRISTPAGRKFPEPTALRAITLCTEIEARSVVAWLRSRRRATRPLHRFNAEPFMVAQCTLIGIGTVAMVRKANSPGSLTSRLTGFAVFGGLGAPLGGVVGYIVGSTGLSVEAGTLIGAVICGCIGAALSRRPESSPLLEKGAAFDYLYDFRLTNPGVANARLVEEALNKIPSFDKNDDGRRWYAKADLDRFLETSTPPTIPPPPASPKATALYVRLDLSRQAGLLRGRSCLGVL